MLQVLFSFRLFDASRRSKKSRIGQLGFLLYLKVVKALQPQAQTLPFVRAAIDRRYSSSDNKSRVSNFITRLVNVFASAASAFLRFCVIWRALCRDPPDMSLMARVIVSKFPSLVIDLHPFLSHISPFNPDIYKANPFLYHSHKVSFFYVD